MLKTLRLMPWWKVLAIGKTVLLARRHYKRLEKRDRQRLAELARRGTSLNREEREEMRQILAKLEPAAFMAATANAFSPVKMPRWVTNRIAR